ncbi:hypothetical protein V6U90_33160, partial [Micromonospora sp. CPCC 206060]
MSLIEIVSLVPRLLNMSSLETDVSLALSLSRSLALSRPLALALAWIGVPSAREAAPAGTVLRALAASVVTGVPGVPGVALPPAWASTWWYPSTHSRWNDPARVSWLAGSTPYRWASAVNWACARPAA